MLHCCEGNRKKGRAMVIRTTALFADNNGITVCPHFPHLLHDLAERRNSQEIPCLAVGAHSLRNAQARPKGLCSCVDAEPECQDFSCNEGTPGCACRSSCGLRDCTSLPIFAYLCISLHIFAHPSLYTHHPNLLHSATHSVPRLCQDARRRTLVMPRLTIPLPSEQINPKISHFLSETSVVFIYPFRGLFYVFPAPGSPRRYLCILFARQTVEKIITCARSTSH
jgi:hypothetical protein